MTLYGFLLLLYTFQVFFNKNGFNRKKWYKHLQKPRSIWMSSNRHLLFALI